MNVDSEIHMAFNPERPKRPSFLPVYSYAFLLGLTTHLTEQMALAIEDLNGADGDEMRRRLVLFWDHVGVYVHDEKLGDAIKELLLHPPSKYRKNFANWFRTGWDASMDGMVELLWRIQATDRVVGAAMWLHANAKYADTSGFRPRIVLK